MKKCHGHHMKVGPKQIRVEATFRDDEMYSIKFLADKYAGGCLAEFVREVVSASLKETFASDLRAVVDAHRKTNEPKPTSPADTEGISPPEE